MILIIPVMFLAWGFPWYAAINRAIKDGNLNAFDYVFQGIPFLFFGACDIYVNILMSPFFFELPFRNYEFTLSQRCCYWISEPDSYRYKLARIVKIYTDKFEKDHITPTH